MKALPAPLSPMAAFRQWICYELVPRADGRVDKLPIAPATGEFASAHSPASWTDFDTAAIWAASQPGRRVGVGFVFTEHDPFWFVDVDHAYVDNAWSPLAVSLCSELQGCAVEVSSSGTGLHIFGTGALPPAYCNKNTKLGLEFYTKLRFVALTGTNAVGAASFPSGNIGAIVQRYFPAKASRQLSDQWWGDAPDPKWHGPADDKELIRRALHSKSAAGVFGGRARFRDLWDAKTEKLAAVWPGNSPEQPYDASSADAALAQHLAFWTGNNAARIERLMRQSQLVRDKWEREDYLQRTITHACNMQTEFLDDAPPAEAPVRVTESGALVVTGSNPAVASPVLGNTLLTADEQIDYFKGCVYVLDQHKVMLPNGQMADVGRFNALYGGRTYVLDATNQKVTRKAFEAFTESQVYRFPRADSTCFRPDAAPGAIISEAGVTKANEWVPIKTPQAKGDPSRILNHIARMLPDERDQQLLIGWMASVVQHQGHKFQWAPLLQGTTGNGKNLIMNCVKHAIGARYCHAPSPANITNHFNAWLYGHTFYCVDEVLVPEKRLDLLEILKPLITEAEGLEITKKRMDSVTRRICGNFAFLTNYREALRLTPDDRRIAPFFTAQQEVPHLERDGMTPAYFADLVDWLKANGRYEGQVSGYAIMSHYLWHYSIPPEFDALQHVRAPTTSSTSSAIAAGMGTIESDIVDAIEEGSPGFRGDWISSSFLEMLLSANRRRFSKRKYDELLRPLGYVPHPALPRGRADNAVAPEQRRSRLFVRKGSAAEHILGRADAAKAYSAAQADTQS